MNKYNLDSYQQKAFEVVLEGKSLFVSGKAGVGKSHLLKNCIVPECKSQGKNIAVVAPTGIAAQNIGGDTLHSFFRLPTAPYLPGTKNSELYNQTLEQIRTIKHLDILIIDEISMVRCDVFDAIDDIMRHYRKNDEPFGGVQVVLFGDLYQLMPVATEEDETLLRKKYKSNGKDIIRKHECFFFFMSHVYKRRPLLMLELERVHRQEDKYFINMLNLIRVGTVGDNILDELNKCLNHEVDKRNSIRLCCLNKTAWGYNHGQLEKLGGYVRQYYGIKEGDVYYDDLPTDSVVELAVGAKVMVIRNDTDGHQYVNGTRGVIKRLNPYSVDIETSDGKRIEVRRCKWYFYRYFYNPQTKVIEQKIRGTFEQIPLRLAWATTIHKSQGLTLDDMVLDASRTFADGQLYVALSRAKSFHKLQFATKITKSYVKTNPDVVEFMHNVERLDIDILPEVESKEKASIEHYSEKVYSMALAGYSIDKIYKESGIRREVVSNDIAKLIGIGKLNVKDYVEEYTYKVLKSFLLKHDIDQPLSAIKKACPSNVSYAEIQMVIADVKRQNNKKYVHITEQQKNKGKVTSTSQKKSEPSKDEKSLIDKIKSSTKNTTEGSRFVRLSVKDDSMDILLLYEDPIYKKAIISYEIASALTTNPDYYDKMYLINCPLHAKKIEKVIFLTKSKKTYEADLVSISFSRASGIRRSYWVAELKLRNLTKK